MRKGLFFIFCIATWLLAACSLVSEPALPEVSTESSAPLEEAVSVLLISTDTLKVERQGTQTTIYDLAGDRIHTLITKKVIRQKTGSIPTANIIIDSETLTVQGLRGVLLITEKSTNTNHLL